MTRQAKIIEGQPFDWNAGREAMDNLVREDGSVNWRAAMGADPGVTCCPTCKEYYWFEGTVLECAVCGSHFRTYDKTLVRKPVLWKILYHKIKQALATLRWMFPYKKRGRWWLMDYRIQWPLAKPKPPRIRRPPEDPALSSQSSEL